VYASTEGTKVATGTHILRFIYEQYNLTDGKYAPPYDVSYYAVAFNTAVTLF